MDPAPRHFPDTGKLIPASAAGAILWTADGRYLMQLRDDAPGIFYPGHVGFFGGAVEEGESLAECAVRELREETSLDLSGRLSCFSELTLDFRPFGRGFVTRACFEGELSVHEPAQVRLSEGVRCELVPGDVLLRERRVIPYDAFVLWQHWVVRFG
ncbi:MAG: NUDIX domain-containing protein [Alphaproteobacteria bacterium]|nr:NUDIX domain-containing protein [Alphaproteobacteria bacterium]